METAGAAKSSSARWAYRAGFAVIAVVVAAVVVLVPVAVASLVHEIRSPPTAATDVLVPQGTLATDAYSVLHLDAVAFDEVQRTLTLHVSGYHVCRTACPYQDTLIFFSVRAESRVAAGLPPAASVALPAGTAPVDATIALPVDGEILFYPFDRYRLVLALAIERVVPGQPARVLTPAEVEGRLVLTVQQHIPRLDFGPVHLTAADRHPVAGGFAFLGVGGVTLFRPRYLQVLVVLGVLLTLAAAICTVLLRPLRELIINTGGLVLGVWGIRALLLGNFPADETIVDIVLTAIIFLQLTAVAIRVLVYLAERGEVHLHPRRARQAGAPAPPAAAPPMDAPQPDSPPDEWPLP